MEKIFLLIMLFGIISCQKESFESEEVNTLSQSIEVRNEPCSGLDYVNIGVVPYGSVNDACQYGICAALYDLAMHYETENLGYISGVDIDFFDDDRTNKVGSPTLTNGISSNQVLVLSSSGQSNYESYLDRLNDNIQNDPENAQYWINFIQCYMDQIPSTGISSQPFDGNP